jgi:ribosomal protein S18 acetylase RimI-like enzyme
MKIFIEAVTGAGDESAMRRIRRDVFERELGIERVPPDMSDATAVGHILARTHPGGEAVGALSVLDTSGDGRLRDGYNLGFEQGARAARLTHLAVLKPFRGRNVPLMMALEAHRLFIAPGGFDYTWLLFDAERAPASFLSRRLGFTPRAEVFASEYGRRRALVRDERAAESAAALRRAAWFLEQSGALYAETPADGERRALVV